MSGFIKRYGGYGAVALSACFFALISQFTKLAYSYGMTPLQLLSLQSGLGALLLLGYGLLVKSGSLRIPAGFLPKLLVYSLIGSLGTNALYAVALVYLPASLGTMLLFTYPVLVTLGAFIFFKERIKGTQVLALGLAVVGTMLSTEFWKISGGSVQMTGILLGLASALAYAFFNLYGEHILNEIEPLTMLTYVQGISALTLLLYQLPSYLSGKAVLFVAKEQFFLGLALATLGSIIPFWLLLVGIKHIGAAKASVIGTLELPAVFLMSYIFLHEQFSNWQLAGAGFILISIVLIRLVQLREGGSGTNRE